jgi:hypothetical protein
MKKAIVLAKSIDRFAQRFLAPRAYVLRLMDEKQ